jgi:NAD(P)-dependent dehydrogenase (short-subunit alcohol dehydrogenase family)
MDVQGSIALVTGANRGLGQAFARELLAVGAAKVYGAVRDVDTITDPGVTPIQLDVTDHARVAAVAAELGDVTLLINNAGIIEGGESLAIASLDGMRHEFEVNAFGPLAMTRAFAPVLARNGGGAVINVLSVVSLIAFPGVAGYSASKSAAWSLTNSLRVELRPQDTLVTAVHVNFMDTDMAAGIDQPKADPQDVARLVLAAVEAGEEEVLADQVSRNVKAALSSNLLGDLSLLFPGQPTRV